MLADVSILPIRGHCVSVVGSFFLALEGHYSDVSASKPCCRVLVISSVPALPSLKKDTVPKMDKMAKFPGVPRH